MVTILSAAGYVYAIDNTGVVIARKPTLGALKAELIAMGYDA